MGLSNSVYLVLKLDYETFREHVVSKTVGDIHIFAYVMKYSENLNEFPNIFNFPKFPDQKRRRPPFILVRPTVVARILLHGGHQEPQLRPHVRQPHLHPDPLGQEPRSPGQVGQWADGISMD